jgi:membrane complex biogenesis BtpA family protein
LPERIAVARIFASTRPLIGMVHLPPLPGAPGWDGSMRAVLDRAVADAATLAEAGFDGLLVENFGDAPFHPGTVPPETTAALAVAVAAVRRMVGLPVGVNALRNDARAALAVSAATGAVFIRVNVHTGALLTDQGWIEGRAHDTLRERARLGLECAILADVLVKHATPPAGTDIASVARDTWNRGLADALVVSGPETGSATPLDRVHAVRDAVPEASIWIGSGLNPANAAALLAVADGGIVGSAVQREGRAGAGVDPERARRLVATVRASH